MQTAGVDRFAAGLWPADRFAFIGPAACPFPWQAGRADIHCHGGGCAPEPYPAFSRCEPTLGFMTRLARFNKDS